MKHTPEEIKNRLSNIGEAIGNIALNYIADLEKENAELKANLDEKENTVHTLDVLHKEAVRKYGEVNDQLTKAKEIIKHLMEFAEMDDREYEKEYKEAEQFLSEVEK